jgi:predicted membrane protein
MKLKFSKLVWGTFLLLAAVFVVVNQLDGFTNFGLGGIIAAIFSLAFAVVCIAHLRFAPLPIPFAMLYIIFRSSLGLPEIKIWALILASLFASAGLAVLLPRRRGGWRVEYGYHHSSKQSKGKHSKVHVESGDSDNNPSINVNFGAVSRRLRSNSLESAQLYCNFGALEVFLDQAQLSGSGAEIILNCNFGAIKLFVPKHWRIIDRLDCTLGGVDIDKRFTEAPAKDAPQLTISGSVSLGGVEIRYV